MSVQISAAAFRLELVKIGAPAILGAVGRALGSPELRGAVQRGLGGLGAGAGVGGLIGAGAGGVGGYRSARHEGADPGQALLGGVSGAARGAGRGALVGGAGLAALEAGGATPGLYGRVSKLPGPLGGSARFGQRQVHALTGWTPRGFLSPEGARQMGAGAAGAVERVGGAGKEMAAAQKALGASERAESMGLTSLPGYARSIKEHGLGKSLKAGVAEQWHSGGAGSKALMLGVPALTVAGELGRSGDETKGRTGRLLGAAGQVGSMALGPLPIAGTLAVNAATQKLTGAAGRLRGAQEHNPAPPETSPSANGLALPTERVYSDRALGEIQVPEGAMR